MSKGVSEIVMQITQTSEETRKAAEIQGFSFCINIGRKCRRKKKLKGVDPISGTTSKSSFCFPSRNLILIRYEHANSNKRKRDGTANDIAWKPKFP